MTVQPNCSCEIPQIVSDGKACETNENPDFFLTGTDIYAPMHTGNKVRFFTTGEDYFDRVGKAIDSAKHTVFITGWQINYDINLRKVDTTKTNNLIKARDKLQAKLDLKRQELDVYNKSLINDPKEQSLLDKFSTYLVADEIKTLQNRINNYNQSIAESRKEQTLWHCLRSAVQRGVKVYVLPWSCPPVGPVITFDIETMCAVYQLNIGLPEARAFFMFSSAKNDLVPTEEAEGFSLGNALSSLGSLFFSHHQKSIIVDNEIGFVGGLDLAYGRRDNANFRLTCDDKIGNDRYNPCIPAIRVANDSEYVNRFALILSTIFDISAPSKIYDSIVGKIDVFKKIDQWFSSPYSWRIAYSFRNLRKSYSDGIEEIQDWAKETFFDPVLGWVLRQSIDLTLVMINIYRQEMSGYVASIQQQIGFNESATFQSVLAKVDRGETLGYTDYLDLIPAVRNWYIYTPEGQLFSSIMDQDLSIVMPSDNNADMGGVGMALIAQIFAALQQNMSHLEKPYAFVDEKPQPLMPRSGKVLDASIQPRMPWHDVHMENQGPAVYDLSRNFIDRWNAGQIFMDKAAQQPLATYKDRFKGLLKFVELIFAKVEDLDEALSFIPFYNKARASMNKTLDQFGQRFMNARPMPQFINLATLRQLPSFPDQTPSKGSDIVQIIRSAPKHLLQYEADARKASGLYLDNFLTAKHAEPAEQSTTTEGSNSQQTTQASTASNAQVESTNDITTVIDDIDHALSNPRETLRKGMEVIREQYQQMEEFNAQFTSPKQIGNLEACQNDCEQAWVKAIMGSQHYIYIENQFFQSDFGEPFGYAGAGATADFNQFNNRPSGPMASLVYFDEDILPIMQYIGALDVLESLDIRQLDLAKFKQVIYALVGKEPSPIPNLKTPNPRLIFKLKEQISSVFIARLTGEVTKRIFATHEDSIRPQTNIIVQTLVERIKKAIYCNETFHTYIIVPVHPEGTLNTDSVMHMIHMAMQTIYGGEKSLVKQIQKAMCIKRLIDEADAKGICLSPEQAEQQALALTGPNNDPLYTTEDWTKYLTLLNLRSWETLSSFKGSRVVTEQIYIHSKLLIVDDRVAIIGSCNINDRSMSGERDSEIAAIVRGGEEKLIPIDGNANQVVSQTVHNFRVNLWRKHFALDIKHDFIDPANSLASYLTKPAALTTAKAIQKKAKKNTEVYNKVFPFIPQNDSPVQGKEKDYPAQVFQGNYPKIDENYYPLGCSIWPQWAYSNPDDHRQGGKLVGQMPFQQEFWDNTLVPYKTPNGVEGFITELPIYWTRGESNISNTAQTIIAFLEQQINIHYPQGIMMAGIPTQSTDTRRT